MLAGACQSLSAQDDDIGKQIWLDYNPRWVLPSNLELFGDVGFRTEFGTQDWSRVIVRPSVRGPVVAFQLSSGVGSFFTKNEILANGAALESRYAIERELGEGGMATV